MSYSIYDNYIAQAPDGTLVAGASVTVYLAGTLTLASIYSDKGVTTILNPATSQVNGRVTFYAESGLYDITVLYNGDTTTYKDVMIGSTAESINSVPSNASSIIDAGASTTLTIKSDDAGYSAIELYGDTQGSGRVFVGQRYNYGGGIEYSGDAFPPYTDAGFDYVVIYRVENGDVRWTARNKSQTDDWEFRSDVYVNTDKRVYSENNVTDGSGAPSGGTNGDIYLRHGVGVYKRISGSWVAMFS